MRKICVITGTRAEYGLLRPLLTTINQDEQFELQLVITGMHLSPEFGMTYQEIESDGFNTNEKVEILLSSDTPVGIAKSMGLAMISFSECYARLKPDLIIVLGDRYEIYAAVSAAYVARIPIAHLHGGETTEGAIDEAFRHSITKMSHLHFTSTDVYRARVIQLGEHPSRVLNVGAIGLENIRTMNLLTKEELELSIGFTFGVKTALLTYHPVTLENATSRAQFECLLQALDQMDNLKVIFTKANSDTDGRLINSMIDEYVDRNQDKAIAFQSMGQLRFLSVMKIVDVVIGNSSSGILEAPSFHVPTVNIGDRQKGRLQAESIINCKADKTDIYNSLHQALSEQFRLKLTNVNNPYGDGYVSQKIITHIKREFAVGLNLKKKFYDLPIDEG